MGMMEEREAYVALNMMEGLGPVRVKALVEALGSPKAIFAADESALLSAKGVGRGLAQKILEQRACIEWEEELAACERLGIDLITLADVGYPKNLKNIHDPPLALYVKGKLPEDKKLSVAMIGSRRSTHYGTQVTDRLAFQLSKAGVVVISGLARGIDAAGHKGCLKGGGETVAVLGSAMDKLYPAEHEDLAEKISQQGAVVSEFPLGTAPGRTTFPMRNRIVSGLSAGVLVVEAARRSGAMITVDEATAQGRLIFAVPGRVDSPASQGCHFLIKQGAKLVADVSDILDEFEYLFNSKDLEVEGARAPALDHLNDAEQQVIRALAEGALNIDELAQATSLASPQLSAMLIGLEMKRLIRMLPGRVVELRLG